MGHQPTIDAIGESVHCDICSVTRHQFITLVTNDVIFHFGFLIESSHLDRRSLDGTNGFYCVGLGDN